MHPKSVHAIIEIVAKKEPLYIGPWNYMKIYTKKGFVYGKEKNFFAHVIGRDSHKSSIFFVPIFAI